MKTVDTISLTPDQQKVLHRALWRSVKILAAVAAFAIATPASAAMPPEAYQGSVWARLMGGFKCVPSHVVLPAFIGSGARAGTYVYFDGATGQCVVGGSPNGPLS